MRANLLVAPLATALSLASAPAYAQLFDKSEFFGSGLTLDTLNGAAPYGQASPQPDGSLPRSAETSEYGAPGSQREGHLTTPAPSPRQMTADPATMHR